MEQWSGGGRRQAAGWKNREGAPARHGRSGASRLGFLRRGGAPGFVAAEVNHDGELFIVVYVPTMPNPTTGFALYFRPEEVFDCGMSVEDAVKFVVSGGVVVH